MQGFTENQGRAPQKENPNGARNDPISQEFLKNSLYGKQFQFAKCVFIQGVSKENHVVQGSFAQNMASVPTENQTNAKGVRLIHCLKCFSNVLWIDSASFLITYYNLKANPVMQGFMQTLGKFCSERQHLN